jgi:hypothetical protein
MLQLILCFKIDLKELKDSVIFASWGRLFQCKAPLYAYIEVISHRFMNFLNREQGCVDNDLLCTFLFFRTLQDVP